MTEAATQKATDLSVGQVAELFGVTVRTLHHYDEIGLVRPVGRSPAGYRLYTEGDVDRLRHVVVYRRLGLGLGEITEILDRPETAGDHLRRQRAAVMSRLAELAELVTAIDRAIQKEAVGVRLTRQEQRELFGDGFSDEYAAEAQQRWGDTDAWKQSQARTSQYSKEDWVAIKAEADAVIGAFAVAKRSGEPADSTAALDAAEAHRRHIQDRFYDLSHDMHRRLADMYLADPRFSKTYEDVESGLTRYVHDAIHANADRNAG
jgi:DNA-binding transcriptional MerR regulator